MRVPRRTGAQELPNKNANSTPLILLLESIFICFRTSIRKSERERGKIKLNIIADDFLIQLDHSYTWCIAFIYRVLELEGEPI